MCRQLTESEGIVDEGERTAELDIIVSNYSEHGSDKHGEKKGIDLIIYN